jgi:uncharacterized membrane protein
MGMIELNLTEANGASYDTEGAAEYLGCSASYLKKLRQIGGGPEWNRLFRRKGVRYWRHELDKWLSERQFGSTTDYPETLP